MSRAFVKEQDDKPEDLTERPVSANPNVVTPRGLRLIDAEIEVSRRNLAQGQHDADKAKIARASRELRYWAKRRATAQVIEPRAVVDAACFGARVTIERDDGRRQTFTIVGEDEADPTKGYIAYTSPLARALMGKGKGDSAEITGAEVEILLLEAIGAEG